MSSTILTDLPRPKSLARTAGWIAVGPLAVMPPVAALIFWNAPAWQLVWSLALAIYAGVKWLTFASYPPPDGTSALRIAGYLLAWPGMNAKAFWDRQTEVPRPEIGEWLFAIFKVSLGLAIAAIAVPLLLPEHPLAAGWAAMVGVVFILHFGILHLLSLAWRAAGVNAEPIMQWPILASSVSDFWGKRWNMAFRDLSFTYVLRPLAMHWGTVPAMLGVFLLSGLVHDVIITLPTGATFGGPTLYFVIQGVGMVAERSEFGRRWSLDSGITGRLFGYLVIVGPVGLLFPEPFVRLGVLPLVTGF